jgi:ADP-ribosylglycohydrolase
VCGLGWTFILSVYAGSAKSYATPAAAAEEEECSDPAEQMAMMAQSMTEEQSANAPEEVAEATEQAQQDESASTGSRVPGRNLASSNV